LRVRGGWLINHCFIADQNWQGVEPAGLASRRWEGGKEDDEQPGRKGVHEKRSQHVINEEGKGEKKETRTVKDGVREMGTRMEWE
jgi:hypothetical protein